MPTRSLRTTGRAIRDLFLPEAVWDYVILEKATSVQQVTELARNGYDLFFNLCDGAADEERPGIEVVETLERLGVPFTGATSNFYEPSRVEMKRACRAEGIATPAYVLARKEADVERAVEELRFPLFVKHYSSYASVGLTRSSRVKTPAGLRRQASKMMSSYGAALIEEYIDGIECTVLVAENPDDPAKPTTYMPMQYRFPDGEEFKHADMKWVDYDEMSSFPVEDPEIAARLRGRRRPFFRSARRSQLRPLRHPRRCGRHTVHAGDQPQLRRLLSRDRSGQRRSLPVPRSRRSRGLHSPARRSGVRSPPSGPASGVESGPILASTPSNPNRRSS